MSGQSLTPSGGIYAAFLPCMEMPNGGYLVGADDLVICAV